MTSHEEEREHRADELLKNYAPRELALLLAEAEHRLFQFRVINNLPVTLEYPPGSFGKAARQRG